MGRLEATIAHNVSVLWIELSTVVRDGFLLCFTMTLPWECDSIRLFGLFYALIWMRISLADHLILPFWCRLLPSLEELGKKTIIMMMISPCIHKLCAMLHGYFDKRRCICVKYIFDTWWIYLGKYLKNS